MDNDQTEIENLKKSISDINEQLKQIDIKVTQILDVMNTFTLLMEEAEDLDDDEDEENHEWTPYDDEEDYEEDDFYGGYGEDES